MARYSKIDRRIWNDAKFRRLSHPEPCGQVLFFYLLTNPFVGPIPGAYSAGEAQLAEALGWDIDGLREAFREAFREGLVKADFVARLVWIPNGIRYNQPENPNVVTHWRDSWDELPECELKREVWEALRNSLSAREGAWLDAFNDACPEPSVKGVAKGMPKASVKASVKGLPNQEQEQEHEPEQEPEHPISPHPSAEPQKASSFDARFSKAELSILAAEIYAEYPRKVGKQDAIKGIEKSIVTISKRTAAENHEAFNGDINLAAGWLKSRTVLYANSPQGQREDKKYIPHPATWFNGARYDDDSETWKYAGASNGFGGRRQAPIVSSELLSGPNSLLNRFKTMRGGQ